MLAYLKLAINIPIVTPPVPPRHATELELTWRERDATTKSKGSSSDSLS